MVRTGADFRGWSIAYATVCELSRARAGAGQSRTWPVAVGDGTMTMRQAIGQALGRSFTVSGRASRPEFWWFWMFHFLLPVALVLGIAPFAATLSIAAGRALLAAGLLLYVATVPAAFCAMIRRQHDAGASGRKSAIVYGIVILIVIATLVFVAAQQPFGFEHTAELARNAGLDKTPAAWLAVGPVVLMSGIMELMFFVVLMSVLVLSAGGVVVVLLLALGAGLARPSQPVPNVYGPAPSEVIQ